MAQLSPNRRRTPLCVLALMLSACSETKEIRVNNWFSIEAKQPVIKGIIAFGPGPSQSYRVRSRGGWRELARGSSGSIVRLHDDTAVLFSPASSAPVQILYEGEEEGHLIGALLGCNARLTITPDGSVIDCNQCVQGFTELNCHQLDLSRYDVATRGVSTAHLPKAPPGSIYLPAGVFAYDSQRTPYFQTRPPAGELSGSACQLLALSPSGLRSWSAPPVTKWGCPDAKAWSGTLGQALREPKRFVAFFGSPPDSIPP